MDDTVTRELLPCPNPWCDRPNGLRVSLVEEEWRVNCRCNLVGPGEKGNTPGQAITAWNTRIAHQPDSALADELRDILDVERYKVAIALQEISKSINGRKWLSEPGRGSYTYDDERYQQEFGAALDEINAALEPLRKIAGDWSNCPTDPLRVATNRLTALGGHHEPSGEAE